jgi:hypothetical protein
LIRPRADNERKKEKKEARDIPGIKTLHYLAPSLD